MSGGPTFIPREVFNETILQFLEPVRPYLEDPAVSEVMINGPDQIYIERKGQLELVPAKFESREALTAALRNMAQFVGKHVDELGRSSKAACPMGRASKRFSRPPRPMVRTFRFVASSKRRSPSNASSASARSRKTARRRSACSSRASSTFSSRAAPARARRRCSTRCRRTFPTASASSSSKTRASSSSSARTSCNSRRAHRTRRAAAP